MTSGNETAADDARSRAALLAEAQEHVRPLTLAARPAADGFVCDLVAVGGSVAVAEYGAGPDELLAVLVSNDQNLWMALGRVTRRGAPSRG